MTEASGFTRSDDEVAFCDPSASARYDADRVRELLASSRERSTLGGSEVARQLPGDSGA